jgi:hypothetical protein
MRRWIMYLVVTALVGVAIIAHKHPPGASGKPLAVAVTLGS